eukprot:Nk52_evm3s298 gene=Nk52_evmTU3s298
MTRILQFVEKLFPPGESIVCMVRVSRLSGMAMKFGRVKPTILCLSLNSEGTKGTISRIELGEIYEVHKQHDLRMLRIIDGKNAESNSPEFSLHFNKVYRWGAPNINEKATFLYCVVKMCETVLGIPTPLLKNMDMGRLCTLKDPKVDQVLEFHANAYSRKDRASRMSGGGGARRPAVILDESIMEAADIGYFVGLDGATATGGGGGGGVGGMVMMEDGTNMPGDSTGGTLMMTAVGAEGEDFNGLTAEEEKGLHSMMDSCEYAIQDCEEFAKQLNADLSALDETTIHALLDSEQDVIQLLQSLDASLEDLAIMHSWLLNYDAMLAQMREDIKEIELREETIQNENYNFKLLLEVLEDLTSKLHIDKETENILLQGKLDSDEGVRRYMEATAKLENVMNISLDPGLEMMGAVKERLLSICNLRQAFSDRVFSEIESLLIDRVESEMVKKKAKVTADSLPSHAPFHQIMMRYRPLVNLLKNIDPNKFVSLSQVYMRTSSRLCKRETQDFFEDMKKKLTFSEKFSSKSLSAFKVHVLKGKFLGGITDAPEDEETFGNAADFRNREQFNEIFGRCLRIFTPYCEEEEQFCCDLFGSSLEDQQSKSITRKPIVRTQKRANNVDSNASIFSQPNDQPGVEQTADESNNKYDPENEEDEELVKNPAMITNAPPTVIRSLIGQLIDQQQGIFRKTDSYSETMAAKITQQAIMKEIFRTLEGDMLDLFHYCVDQDMFNSFSLVINIDLKRAEMNMQNFASGLGISTSLSITSESVTNRRSVMGASGADIKDNSVTFLQTLMESAFSVAERTWIETVDRTIKIIEDFRTSRKSGLLPYVQQFPILLAHFEMIRKNTMEEGQKGSEGFGGSEKLVTEGYIRLAEAVIENMTKVVSEFKHSHIALFENFYHFFNEISLLKIPCLDAHKKAAQRKYRESLQSYIEVILGTPMESLSQFVDGVERLLESGVQEEQVSFQLAFSKQELKKCIKAYPGKEVKKGLEHVYKKVLKHASQPQLVKVVWLSMQDDFIRQYNHFESLIARCYPGSGIKLEFDLKDLLSYFQEITSKGSHE